MFFPGRDTWQAAAPMALKTPTPLQKENRPIVQKVMETCPRDSDSPEPRHALVKALRVGHLILSVLCQSFYCLLCLSYVVTTRSVWLLLQILQIWNELQTTMSLLHWRPQETPPHLNLSWTSQAPTPLMTRARPKTKPTETRIKTSPIDPSAAAATRPTTLTWNAPHQGVIHLVRSPAFCKLSENEFDLSSITPSTVMIFMYQYKRHKKQTFSTYPGHLTGKHERHFAVSGCPLYHNLSADECKVISSTTHWLKAVIKQKNDEP